VGLNLLERNLRPEEGSATDLMVVERGELAELAVGMSYALVGSPGQDGLGTVAQGFLEGSNVEVVTEMIDLITSQRAYEVNQKVIEAADQMLERTTR
jgi:flagellar basal-body rod protein FlgG